MRSNVSRRYRGPARRIVPPYVWSTIGLHGSQACRDAYARHLLGELIADTAQFLNCSEENAALAIKAGRWLDDKAKQGAGA
jgi:hypothetical protein